MTTAAPERLLQPSEEKLFRQVRRHLVEDGEPSSLAFKALPKDNGELSVDLESLTTAQKACEDFLANGGDSAGSWAVTTLECKNLGLDAYHKAKPTNPSHGYISFKTLKNDKAYRKMAGDLAELAIARGPLFLAPVSAPEDTSQANTAPQLLESGAPQPPEDLQPAVASQASPPAVASAEQAKPVTG